MPLAQEGTTADMRLIAARLLAANAMKRAIARAVQVF
jgi:hypothetical protein